MNPTPDPRAELLALIDGFRVSQALHAVATLRVADELAGGQRTLAELASATDSDPSALYRLLRAAATVGVLEELPDRSFSLTELGQNLRSDAPGSVADWARFVGRSYHWNAWSRLTEAVRTGGHAFRMEHGTDVWTYRRERPEESVIFNRAMNANSNAVSEGVVAAHDFTAYRAVVDVGGGGGKLISAVLGRHPGVRGVLFDQPHIVEDSRAFIESLGLGERCQLVGGSFFEAVPEGGDAYLMKSILHDWRDAECARILEACHRAMGRNAILLVIEQIVAPPNLGQQTKFSDLQMFVAAGGAERTAEEWRTLLAGSGFEMRSTTPAAADYHVIEAVPV